MRIISGGDVGVQLGALFGVKLYNTEFEDSGVSTFGYVAKGWKTSSTYPMEKPLRRFCLQEDQPTPGFGLVKSRDIRNIDEADVVVVISFEPTKSHLSGIWYALHDVYNHLNVPPLEKDYEVIEAGKRVVIIKNLTFETVLANTAHLADAISNAKSVVFLGDSEERSPGIQDLTKFFVYTVLKWIYGKEEFE